MKANEGEPGAADEFDPVLLSVLAQLWQASRAAPDRAWSLAKLSKRAQVPMSDLRRGLTQLQGAGLVAVTAGEDGRECAVLQHQGLALCAALFDA